MLGVWGVVHCSDADRGHINVLLPLLLQQMWRPDEAIAKAGEIALAHWSLCWIVPLHGHDFVSNCN